MREIGFWRGNLTDAKGLWDIANFGLMIVTFCTLGSIIFVGLVMFFDWFRCQPILATGGGVLLQGCRFDSGGFGIAVRDICFGYSTALGALAAYMWTTRERQPPPPQVTP